MPLSTYAIFESSESELILDHGLTPELKEGELLVKIAFTTLCRSDMYTYTGVRHEHVPTILGHEIVGHIESFGPHTSTQDLRGQNLVIGSKITWAIYASDPHSRSAQRGIPQKAEGLFKYGHERITSESNFHGGLSEYIVLRKNTPIIRLQDDLPDAIAAMINCAVATVSGAMRLAGHIKNQQVLINGAGMLGLIACAMAKVMGAQNILVLDADVARAEMAKNFGADDVAGGEDIAKAIADCVQDDPSGRHRINVLLEFSGIPQAIENTLSTLDIGGVAVWVGATFPQDNIVINAEYIVRRLLTIKGLHNYNAQDLIHAVEFIEQHHMTYDFNRLIARVYPLAQVNDAFRYAVCNNPYRVGIKIN